MPPILFPLGGAQVMTSQFRRGVPPTLHGVFLLPAAMQQITGISRDNNGVALAGCTCTLFLVTQDNLDRDIFTQWSQLISDASGNYSFQVGNGGRWRVTWDLDGVPIRAGISLKTLTPTT